MFCMYSTTSQVCFDHLQYKVRNDCHILSNLYHYNPNYKNLYLLFSNSSFAILLRAVELFLWFINWRVSWEQIDSQLLITFPFFFSHILQSFKLHKCLWALPKAFIEEASKSHQTIDIFSLQFFLVLYQSHSCLHCSIVVSIIHILNKSKELLLVKLSLT